MIQILLTKDQIAYIDDEDEILAKYNWYADGNPNKYYAKRNNHGKTCRLHRCVMERMLNRKLNTGEEVDHKDNNGLNNTRSNLRLASRTENNRNRKNYKQNRYKGTSFNKRINKWIASITINGKTKGLGYYNTEIEAAKAYDFYAIKYFKEFARTNDLDISNIIINKQKPNTGYVGVTKRKNKFEACFYFNKKYIYVGLFDTAIEAYNARIKKKYELLISAQ